MKHSEIDYWIANMLESPGNVSDLNVTVGKPLQVEMSGVLTPVAVEPAVKKLTPFQAEVFALNIIGGNKRLLYDLVHNGSCDLAYSLGSKAHFRVNIFSQKGHLSTVLRILPTEIPTIDSLNLPPIFKEMPKELNGFILVTGSTGSGKSTTLASMLHEINMTERRHIITVEDPVEFVHKNEKSLFSQRDVGTDTNSFASALKYALRQDPDIILIGEMRDAETIGAALTAAETGHLVFGTLHTNSAPGTINRIIDVFDGQEQAQIRAQLATSLIAVISQTLIPKIEKGKVATQEILITNSAVQNQIREDKVHQIYSQMQLNQNETHMTTQTQQLIELLQKRIITKENAIKNSNRPEELMKLIVSL